jgi:LacI family transcriptional regulator
MTLKQLAKELNLSFSTVSKALRDSHEISESTKKRVLAKARELNYQVNPVASSLRKQKSKTIAVIIPEVVNDFFGPVINGIESVAHEKGYHVLIYLTHEDINREVAITQLLQNGRVDGILMSVSEQTSNTNHLEELRQKEIPLVFIDRVVRGIDAPKVVTNNYESGYKATELLLKNGCKRVAYLSISRELYISNLRMQGYLDALKANKVKADQSLIIECESAEDKSRQRILKLLDKKSRPDGVFAAVEKLALQTYEACQILKLKIPRDVKLITFSNSYTAPMLNPSLSTITQPAFDMGRESATILFKLIEKKGHHFLKEETILDSTVIARDSTNNKNR